MGAEDLAANGVWREEAEYGIVWAPRVAVGWAPYQSGHWAWVEPWGWTWIDDAPWGFAPFHYGRWAYLGGGWVWAPGARVGRPVYAPALVVFVGSGPNVAWFALGPREPYIPGYRVSQAYVRRVNITHVNVTNISAVNVRYANREVPGAVMAVPQRTFMGARPVGQSRVAISREEISRGQVVHSVPVAPGREARLGRAPSGVVVQPPARVQDRHVVARTPPPQRTGPAVRQIQPAERRMPTRIEAGQPAITGPGQGRPAMERPAAIERPRNVERPNVERPAVVQPPVRMERPAEVERPRNPERPNVERPAVRPPVRTERPAEAERPARTERPAQPERREAQPERRREPQPRSEEPQKQEERKAHTKTKDKKDDK